MYVYELSDCGFYPPITEVKEHISIWEKRKQFFSR